MPETKLIIKVIIFVVLLLVGFIFIAPIFGFDFIRFVTAETITTDMYQPQDRSNDFFYEDYADLQHPGMILTKDSGVDNIDEVLKSRQIVTACSDCSNCNEISPSDLEFNATNCSSCYICEGKSTLMGDINADCIIDITDVILCTARDMRCDLNDNGIVDAADTTFVASQVGKTCTGLEAKFKNCLECTNTTPTGEPYKCSICEDVGEEYELCRKIKDCIKNSASWPEYYKKYGCPAISEISHNELVNFNINTLKNVLSSCRDESIKLNIGHNITRELCYFNNSSISYYDFNRPNDFYMNHKLSAFPPPSDNYAFWVAYSDGLTLTPFYKEGEEYVPHYRIYVSVYASSDTNFEVYAGHYHPPPIPLPGTTGATDYKCKLGEIKTDSTGFGYGEFIEIPDDCKDWTMTKINLDEFKKNPEKYHLNGVEVHTPGVAVYVPLYGVYASFYANKPESSGTWNKDLRYARCNFATNPEPYLSRLFPLPPIFIPEKPWWITDSDSLMSSWFTFGDPLLENANSSIKVFYDSTMPGGGNSINRGNIKISIGRLDTDLLRDCKFDIYICSQDAFAEYDEERILTLNDFSTDFNPMNVYKTKKVDADDDGFKESQFIIYNYFLFGLDKNYTVEEIRSAIKTGFRIWEQFAFIQDTFGTSLEWLKSDNNDGIYQGYWNEVSGGAGYNENCWNNNVENLMKTNNKNLIGNCQDNICSEKLKIRVSFKYTEPNATALGDGFKRPLYPTITFCGFAPSFCPDKCEGGFEYRDGSGVPCTYATVKKCNYGCYDSVRCNQGKLCQNDTTSCGCDTSIPCSDTCPSCSSCVSESAPTPSCGWTMAYCVSPICLPTCIKCIVPGVPPGCNCNGDCGGLINECCILPRSCQMSCVIDTVNCPTYSS